MPADTEAATLRARLETIIKEGEDVEAQATTARHHVQAAPPPPLQGHRLGANGYRCPSARDIFAFIVIFPGRGLAARPHRPFELRRHGHHRTLPLDDRSAQRPSSGEHHHRLLLHQQHLLA
jgi:hypothetical protein